VHDLTLLIAIASVKFRLVDLGLSKLHHIM